MAYCGNCGKELPEGTAYCPECGTAVNPPVNNGQGPYGPGPYPPGPYPPGPGYPYYKPEEKGAMGWFILSFVLTLFTTIGGVILCIVFFATGKQKSGVFAMLGALVVIIPMGIYIVAMIVYYEISRSSGMGFIGIM